MITLQINQTIEFLRAINRIVPSAEFIVTAEGVTVRCVNDSHTIRCFFNSKCIISSENNVRFCMEDITKLNRALTILKNRNIEEIELEVTDEFIEYNSKSTGFKIHVIKQELISLYISEELNTKLEPLYNIRCNNKHLKDLIRCINIVDSEDSKVYILNGENKDVIGMIGNNRMSLMDSAKVCIGKLKSGNVLSEDIILTTDFIGLLTSFKNDFDLIYTKQLVLDVQIQHEDMKIQIVASTIK